jgi:cupin superfamily acireductone dioxygenase involved in methionine salvage
VDGQATYIMVLKDAGGLVKLYALVNVEQYGIVATGNTQAEAMRAYKELLVQNGIVEKDETDDPIVDALVATVTVTEIKTYTVDGNTVFYIKGDDGKYYKGYLKTLEDLIFVSEGDKYTVDYAESENPEIREIIDINKIEETVAD